MPAAITTMTPDRMIIANLDSMPPGWKASKFKDTKTRCTQYRLNDKATEKKLKSFAILKDLHVSDIKLDRSHTIQFSTGSYLTTVVPLLELYKQLLDQEVTTIALNDGTIDIEVKSVDKKCDKKGTVVEHLVRLLVGGEKVTVTLYDTTCSMRIQGDNDQQVRYTTLVLTPHLEAQVLMHAKQSKAYNDRMTAYNVAEPAVTPRQQAEPEVETSLSASNPAAQMQELQCDNASQVEEEPEVDGTPLGTTLVEVDGSLLGTTLVASAPSASPARMLELQQQNASQGLDAPNACPPADNAHPAVPAPQPDLRKPPPPPPTIYPEVQVRNIEGAPDAEEIRIVDSFLEEDDGSKKKGVDSANTEQVRVIIEVEENDIEMIAEEFVCSLCDRSFPSLNELSPHEKEHGDLTPVTMMRKIIALEALVSKLSKAAPPPLCSAALTHILSSPSSPSFASVTAANSRPNVAEKSKKDGEKSKKFKPAPRPRGKIDIHLFADSISSNIVGPSIENATGSLLYTTKAYAAQADEVAKFQNKVVSKVVRRHQRPVHTAIIGAPSVDITNQSTAGGTQDENVVTTVASSHSIVESAEFLIKSGKAKQVILMEHTPRYDDTVKADLATLANKTLHTARNESEFAENILVGSHTGLDVSGEERRRRFTNDGSNSHSKHVRAGANDQLHMYSQAGALAITKSLTNILAQAGLVKERTRPAHKALFPTNPYEWQVPAPRRGFQTQGRAFSQNQNSAFQIPTLNRFQGFW